MLRYCDAHPPVHVLVAAYLRYKPVAETKKGNVEELAAMFGGIKPAPKDAPWMNQ